MVRVDFTTLYDIAKFSLDNCFLTLIIKWQDPEAEDGAAYGRPMQPWAYDLDLCLDGDGVDELPARVSQDAVHSRTLHGRCSSILPGDRGAGTGDWDCKKFVKDLLQECYFPPLELEDAGNGTFLENEFHVDGQSISYTLKSTLTRWENRRSYGVTRIF